MKAGSGPLRLIGYLRVSTGEQANGYGLGAQADKLRSWCEAEGHELVTFHIDVISSRRTDRMLSRAAAIAAIEAGVADGLLVRALDRASRSVLDGARLLEDCASAGVRVMSCDGYDSADEDTQFTGNIKIAVAQEERRLISRRTREGLARARAEGKRLGRESTVPPEVVARIAAERAMGNSYRLIARDLDAAGIPTPGGSPTWRAAAVQAICQRASTSAGVA